MKYNARPIPDNPLVQRELQKVAESITSVHQHEVLHRAPENPRRGLVVFADGTDWNPGGGEGLYVYLSTGWSKL